MHPAVFRVQHIPCNSQDHGTLAFADTTPACVHFYRKTSQDPPTLTNTRVRNAKIMSIQWKIEKECSSHNGTSQVELTLLPSEITKLNSMEGSGWGRHNSTHPIN